MNHATNELSACRARTVLRPMTTDARIAVQEVRCTQP